MEEEIQTNQWKSEENPMDSEAKPNEKDAAEQPIQSESIQKLKEFTDENENSSPSSVSLRSILGGDFLNAAMVRKQLPLIILVAVCCFIYISNRYSNQMELIEIDKLKNQLDDIRYNSLTRSSELTAKSRQSYIEAFLRNSQDSTLQTSTNPPYVIYTNKENQPTDSIADNENE